MLAGDHGNVISRPARQVMRDPPTSEHIIENVTFKGRGSRVTCATGADCHGLHPLGLGAGSKGIAQRSLHAAPCLASDNPMHNSSPFCPVQSWQAQKSATVLSGLLAFGTFAA